MRVLGCAMGLVGVMAVAVGAPVPKDPPKEAPYFPTRRGDTAVYEWNAVPKAEEMTEVVTAVASGKDGTAVVNVARSHRGGPASEYKVEASARGVFQLGSPGGLKYDPPICWVRPAAASGDRWETTGSPNRTTFTIACRAAGRERVVVAAGAFECVRVECDFTETTHGTTQRRRRTMWHAPGVGLVKVANGEHVELTLKSFTPGPP